MDFDRDTQEFVFNDADKWALGHPNPPMDERVPASEISRMLTRATDRLVLNAQLDPSELPAGALKNKYVQEQMRRSALLLNIIGCIRDSESLTLAAEAEEFLRSETDN